MDVILLAVVILAGLFIQLQFTHKPFLVTSKNALVEKKTNSQVFPYPEIDTIFAGEHLVTSQIPAAEKITIIATGDVIPARSVNFQTLQHGDFHWPFKNVYELTKDADITFINLETPLLHNCPVTNEGMSFCGDARHVQGLLFAGVDIASLANNHAGNHGKAGVDETIEILKKNGIDVTGIEGPLYKKIKGIRFAFLGYNDIEKNNLVSTAEEVKIKREIAESKKNADVVIVTYHWGAEYQDQPDERQKELGRMTIDAGADLVIGNHPHWIQPIEIYKGKLITYAHGNFIFDQEWSQKTKEGVLGRYTFNGKDLVDIKYLPLEIRNFGQPIFLEGEKKQKILEEMKDQSFILRSSSKL